jgi:penicillin-binding protein 2
VTSSSTEKGKGTLAPHRRFYWAQVAVTALFAVLAGRLWQLQVLAGDHYFRKSADNFVKDLELPAVRGQIRDRKGRVLADNRPSYNVYVTPRFLTDEALARLQRYLALGDDQVTALRARIAQKHGLDRFHGLLAFEDITRDQLALLESERNELPGVAVEAVAHRSYPHGALASHVLGYMNQIGPDELPGKREQGYRLGDYVGRAGLERQWESFLRGKDGVERIVVDAKGQRKVDVDQAELDAWLGGPQRMDPVPGHDLMTTLDLELQNITENALKKHKSAAAAVVDVETGRVLALASWPEPDPNVLTGRLTRAQAAALASDPGRPLIDKTLRENYFPGSTFKIAPSLAALEDQLIDPSAIVTCHGSITFGRRAFHCVEPHGKVNLHQALSQSCNVYFFELGDKLGLDRIARVAEDLGFGATTGLGLNGEVPGFIPNMSYYKKVGGFQKGMVLNTAIGQGSVKVTVLQLAMAYAAVANGGKLWVPQIVERIQTPSGQVVQEFPPRLRRILAASPEMLQRLRVALADAVNDPKGTSFAARVPGLDVAGKTGTAQVRNNRHVRDSDEADKSADHAWFASFAPSKHPKIAVVVLVEHGGFGAKAATPTAMEIYQGYFDQIDPDAKPRALAEKPHAKLPPSPTLASGAR